MDNENINMESFKAILQKDLNDMKSITSYTVKEVVAENLEIIEGYKNKGLNLKQVCEKFNSNGTKIKYGTFQRAYQKIKEGT